MTKCPWRIGIVSLIINGDDAAERGALAKKSFGVVILDEAHKARAPRESRGGNTTMTLNNLLRFLSGVARNAGSVLLGTATPIQLDAVALWICSRRWDRGRNKFSVCLPKEANGRGMSQSAF